MFCKIIILLYIIYYIYIYIYICMYVCMYVCICYVMPRVLYQVYNHRAQGPQARGRGDYKPDIARVGMT